MPDSCVCLCIRCMRGRSYAAWLCVAAIMRQRSFVIVPVRKKQLSAVSVSVAVTIMGFSGGL